MYYMCTVSVCVCVYTCVSFYVSVMCDHVVDSYSPGLYYVNVSLNYFVHRRKLPWPPSCAMSWKKIILNTFLSNVEHAKCLVETRIHQMSKDTTTRQFPVSVGVSRQQNLCIGSRRIGFAMGLWSVRCSLLSEWRFGGAWGRDHMT